MHTKSHYWYINTYIYIKSICIHIFLSTQTLCIMILYLSDVHVGIKVLNNCRFCWKNLSTCKMVFPNQEPIVITVEYWSL